MLSKLESIPIRHAKQHRGSRENLLPRFFPGQRAGPVGRNGSLAHRSKDGAGLLFVGVEGEGSVDLEGILMIHDVSCDEL